MPNLSQIKRQRMLDFLEMFKKENDHAGSFHSYMVVFLLSRLKKVVLYLLVLANL